MARPSKVGLDYFPLDIHVDDKIELLEAEHGLEGFAIIIKLYQKIYANGYFIEWNEDTCMLFSKNINTAKTTVNDVVNTCLRRGLFNKSLHKQFGILTSKGIQDRYLTICKSARRRNILMIEEYILVVNTELTSFIAEFIELSSAISTQSKGKKSKGKESKEEISVPLKDGSFYSITQKEIDEFIGVYEKIDCVAEIKKLRLWNISNVDKRKTRRGFMKHVNSWLSSANDKHVDKSKTDMTFGTGKKIL